MLIDTHAHLDFREFDHDRDEVIKRAEKFGVKKIINVGCNLERSQNSIDLAGKHDNIYAAVGVHPHDVGKYEPEVIKRELEKLAKSKKVVAIGECGLDYYRLESNQGITKQKEVFKRELKLAHKLNLPLIIHCRNAFEDLLAIVKNETKKLKIRGVTHCFSGTLRYAREFINLGFLVSFTGSITYARPKSEILPVIREIPLSKIMVETDSPYLAPAPYRGKRNEPSYVKLVAEKIAKIKGLDFIEVAGQTSKNAKNLFGL
jgi:TatD DNase family protein